MGKSRPSKNPWAYVALGSELAGSVLVPVLLGLWADGKLGWAPVGVICGAVLGMALAGTMLVRLVMRADDDA